MSHSTATDRMLEKIQRRLNWGRWSRRCLLNIFWLGLAATLMMPLFWLWEGAEWRTTLLVVPVVLLLAAILAWLMTPRATADDAARAADRAIDGNDLFLTSVRLRDRSGTVGEFAPLVLRDAESAVPRVNAELAAPIVWQRPLGWAASGLAVVLISALLIPQFDPFGTVAAAEVTAKEHKRLKSLQEETKQRKQELRSKQTEAQLSDEVVRSIDDFKKSLRQMQPNNPKRNQERLAKSQEKLGDQWRKTSAEALQKSLQRQNQEQQFGSRHSETLMKWQKELQQGSTESIRKELQDLKEQLQSLAKTEDPAERQEKLRDIEKRMKSLEDFARQSMDSKPLAAALERAMQQLDAARKAAASDEQQQQMAQEALSAMKESLELSELELQEIAQSARDLQEIEKALKTLQEARQANQNKPLDGAACEGCVSLEDYQALYAAMSGGRGSGQGTGGEGFGEGGEVPEDDSVATDFTPEQSKSAITAGKILLSLKSKGLSDSGDAEQNYAGQIDQVKQGVSEAILAEQIPPGYHDNIKHYFDTLKAEEQPPR